MDTSLQEEFAAPLQLADAHRLEVSPTLDARRRSKLGQFMTPKSIAELMASMFDGLSDEIRLLDAGAGMGALTAAFVTDACGRTERPKSIDVTAFEVDHEIASVLELTLRSCEVACSEAGIAFTFRIINDDYIVWSAEMLLHKRNTFNCAILNPPYGKINSHSNWRRSLRSLGVETVNLYSAFVALAIQQLEDGGQLVAITPRSFCNGSYYEPFRKLLLESSAIKKIHVFESRKTAFKDDDVLQENMIFHLLKAAEQSLVSLSTDQQEPREVEFCDVVRENDKHVFIRLPLEANDLASRIQALPCSLSDLGIQVSTGRVVDFRARDHLRKMPEPLTVPLIYPAHFDNGGISWPLAEFKKNNALSDNSQTERLIVPAGIYVLIKRFSAKEEKRRLVAAIYDGQRVGFENHLNYFHEDGQGLPLDLARGLAAFLNSEVVDQYFRIFSGHTQVNATDLRNMHYPSRDQLEMIGRSVPTTPIDEAVAAVL